MTDDEETYLESLKVEIIETISEQGELGDVQIKEIVLDELLRYNFDNLISYALKNVPDNGKIEIGSVKASNKIEYAIHKNDEWAIRN